MYTNSPITFDAYIQFKFFGLEDPTAERILDDWRNGRLGLSALEPPPTIPYHTGYYRYDP